MILTIGKRGKKDLPSNVRSTSFSALLFSCIDILLLVSSLPPSSLYHDISLLYLLLDCPSRLTSMCGSIAIVALEQHRNKTRSRTEISQRLENGLAQIKHRGPDSQGQWVSHDDRVGPSHHTERNAPIFPESSADLKRTRISTWTRPARNQRSQPIRSPAPARRAAKRPRGRQWRDL